MPIVMSKAELARIKRWTETDREDPEVVRRRELIKYLDTTSREMTKSWPNSLENVNKRNEELRRARIEAAEQANTNFYKRYLKRQQEEQQRLMYSAKDTVFKNKDAPKLLLSAVIETCIQKERAEQVKFLAEQRRLEAERKRQDDDDIIRRAKEWSELVAVKAKRRFDVNKQHQREILEQAHEVAEKKRIEYETELNMQKIDNMKANQQMEAIKEFEQNFNAAEKRRIWADMEGARREAAARSEERRARDLMDDRLLDVLLRSRARVEARRIKTEKDLKEEKRRVLESISAKLESGDAARNAREQEILDKAVQEKEAIAEKRRQAAAAQQAQFRRDRQLQRENFLEGERQRLHDFNNKRQFEIMNRFKNAELYEEFQEKLRQEKARKIKEFREDTLRLRKEREEREARERAETRYFYGELAERKLRDADNRLLAHAADLIQEARDHGRPDLALVKALDCYCKLYRLYPMPELPASLQEHYGDYAPRDTSRPDAGYRAPPPPPPPPPPADDDDPEPAPAPAPGSNGLQDPLPSTSKPSAEKKEEHVDDYKRIGRANGLQRRNAETDLTLPPIAVIPCEVAVCTCGTRK